MILRKISELSDADARRLMDVYAESNRENVDYFFPGTEDREAALLSIERDFIELVRGLLLKEGNAYWVLEEAGEWLCALRTYTVGERLFYIEALETRPDSRRRGLAKKLLLGVVGELKRGGAFRICDCVDKENLPSVRAHGSAGFTIVADPAHNYLSGGDCEWEYGFGYSYDPE